MKRLLNSESCSSRDLPQRNGSHQRGLRLLRRREASRAAAMAVKVVELKRIEYDPSLIPAEGSQVSCEFAAPAKLNNKDAAGHAFHAFALRQAGHVGACIAPLHLVCYPTEAVTYSRCDKCCCDLRSLRQSLLALRSSALEHGGMCFVIPADQCHMPIELSDCDQLTNH